MLRTIPTPEEAADGLDALNDMMNALELQGVYVSWDDKTLTDDFPLPNAHIQGVKAMLAQRLTEDFGKPVSSRLKLDAMAGFKGLRVQFNLFREMKTEKALLNFSANRRC